MLGDSSNEVGDGPLHWSIRCKKASTLKLMLNRGHDVNKATSSGETPLHCAMINTNYEALRMLLDHGGVLLDKLDVRGCSALSYAIMLEMESSVELLLERGANCRRAGGASSCLELAIESRASCVQTLLHFGAHEDGETFEYSYPYRRFTRYTDLLMSFGVNWHFASDDEMLSFSYIREVWQYQVKSDMAEINPDLEAANPYRDVEHQDYRARCDKELRMMKGTYLDENKLITAYDFLRASRNSLINYSRNEVLRKKLEALLRKGSIDIYADIVRMNCVIGDRYARIYDRTPRSFDPEGRFTLPPYVFDKVLDHLNERDINNFIMSHSLK